MSTPTHHFHPVHSLTAVDTPPQSSMEVPSGMQSETATIVESPHPMLAMSNGKRYALLLIFTVAQFMDVASNSMVRFTFFFIPETLS
jgi:hypothetical protein